MEIENNEFVAAGPMARTMLTVICKEINYSDGGLNTRYTDLA